MSTDKYTKLTKDEFYKEFFFNRMLGILTEEEVEKLKNSTVAVAGSGGGGGITAERLVRLGIGHIKLADIETFEPSNANRQHACTSKTIGKEKVKVVAESLREINPYLEIDVFNEGVQEDNIHRFLDGADVLIDEVEGFYLRIRAFLHAEARRKGIYAMRSDTFAFSAPLWVFAPDGMSFEEFWHLPDAESISHNADDFMNYFTPEYAARMFMDDIKAGGISEELAMDVITKKRPLPTLSFGCSLIATLVCNEALNVLLKKYQRLVVVPKCINVDLYNHKFVIKNFEHNE